MLDVAIQYAASGLSIIPCEKETKRPLCGEWKSYQTTIAQPAQLEQWFNNGQCVAVIGGPISGNLEVIDFDDPVIAREWQNVLKSWNCEPILKKLVLERSQRGGHHAAYRHSGKPSGNMKLAMRPPTLEEVQANSKAQAKALIETRGDGGYCLVAPSNGYKLLQHNWLSLPMITPEERECLLAAARSLCRVPPDRSSPKSERHRAGDEYNERASIAEVLAPMGWQRCRGGRNEELWVRPGKEPRKGHSATWNYNGNRRFVVFSSSAGIDCGSYDLFGLYARLHHNGDFNAAARDIGASGYGTPPDQAARQKAGLEKEIETDESGGLSGVTFDNKTFDPTEVEFLWEPYLPFGKIVLFDADGGTQKTCLMAAMAAGFSNGILPFGAGECKPVKTAYFHKGEDENEEIATVFHANGGDFQMIEFFQAPTLNLTAHGLDLVQATILRGGFQFVVFDALFYFCQHLRTDGWKDPLLVLPILEGLKEVAKQTRCVIGNLRHTTKGWAGKLASEMGFGTQAFRNSHRGQLVMRYSPAEKGLVVVTDEKGSLLVERGESFAFRRIGHRVEYIQSFDNPFDEKDTFAGRKALKGLADDWLRSLLASGPQLAQVVWQKGHEKQLSPRVLQMALSRIGGESVTVGFGKDRVTTWQMKPKVEGMYWQDNDNNGYDPYTDF